MWRHLWGDPGEALEGLHDPGEPLEGLQDSGELEGHQDPAVLEGLHPATPGNGSFVCRLTYNSHSVSSLPCCNMPGILHIMSLISSDMYAVDKARACFGVEAFRANIHVTRPGLEQSWQQMEGQAIEDGDATEAMSATNALGRPDLRPPQREEGRTNLDDACGKQRTEVTYT